MNYPQKQFEVLCQDLPILLSHYGLTKEVGYTVPLLHNLHYKLYSQKNSTDDNLNIVWKDGKRLFKQDDSFMLYPDRCNDNQIETAMKKAIKIIFPS